jgi:2-polyprenyl-6-hydroxyphenyl methylase / 3-demethylubiquinone-9 3-methyltransferase
MIPSIASSRWVHSRPLNAILHWQQLPQRRWFSVSTDEVNKFGKMHPSWWEASQNPLIRMNVIRVQYIQQHIQQLLPGHPSLSDATTAPVNILDVGCGGGLLSESLARLGGRVTGIDPSADLIQAAQAHALLDRRFRNDPERLTYRTSSVEDLLQQQQQQQQQSSVLSLSGANVSMSTDTTTGSTSQGNEEFDVVCLLEVIEHVTDIDPLISTATRLMKPQGLLFVSTMSPTFLSYLITIVGAEYVMGYLPIGTHDWSQYQSPTQVQTVVERHGLQACHVSGMIPVLSYMPLIIADWKLDPSQTNVNWIGVYQKSL